MAYDSENQKDFQFGMVNMMFRIEFFKGLIGMGISYFVFLQNLTLINTNILSSNDMWLDFINLFTYLAAIGCLIIPSIYWVIIPIDWYIKNYKSFKEFQNHRNKK